MLVTNVHAKENTASAYDCHPWSTDVTFSGCSAVANPDHGFANRGIRTKIIGCRVQNVGGAGVYIDYNSQYVSVTGCDISDTGESGIIFGEDTGSTHRPSDIYISGNYIHHVGQHGIYMNVQVDHLAITGNHFDTCDLNDLGIYTSNKAWNDVTIANNTGSRIASIVSFSGGSSTDLTLLNNVVTAKIGTNDTTIEPTGTNTRLKQYNNY
jgi:hypothetical protein